MIEFSKTLRSAREAKGLSLAHLAEITHMAPSRLEELENANFSHIPAPIYGRGFIKLYCEAVGIEAKPVIDEYMAIINGERDGDIKERPIVVNEPKPTPSSVPSPTPAEESKPTMPPIQESKPASAASTEPPKIIDSEPPIANFDLFSASSSSTATDESTKNDTSFSRYAAPIRQTRVPVLPTRLWRMAVLSVLLVAVIVAIALGIRALYRATSAAPASNDDTPTAHAILTNETPPAPAAKAPPRSPKKVKSLYID